MDSTEMIEDLRAALAELESGEGLGRFVEGHGLQSRFFAFSWHSDNLVIECTLPYARVLSSEDEQSLDSARIGVAIRLAILLLASSAKGTLLADGEELISVNTDESGARYSVLGRDGEVMDSGEDLEPLVARLDAALPGGDDVQIIWP